MKWFLRLGPSIFFFLKRRVLKFGCENRVVEGVFRKLLKFVIVGYKSIVYSKFLFIDVKIN